MAKIVNLSTIYRMSCSDRIILAVTRPRSKVGSVVWTTFNALKDLKLNVTLGNYHRCCTCVAIHAGCQGPESTDIQLRLDNYHKQYSGSHEMSHAASGSGQSDDLVITCPINDLFFCFSIWSSRGFTTKHFLWYFLYNNFEVQNLSEKV